MLELARESDWQEIKRLSVQIHDLHAAWRPDIYISVEEPYPYEVFLQDMQKRQVYVAKLEENIIGYVVLSTFVKEGAGTVKRKIMRLESICVDEPFRGHGLGKKMVNDVWALAKAFRCSQLMLGVHAENDSAIGFYQKCGFRIRTINMDMDV